MNPAAMTTYRWWELTADVKHLASGQSRGSAGKHSFTTQSSGALTQVLQLATCSLCGLGKVTCLWQLLQQQGLDQGWLQTVGGRTEGIPMDTAWSRPGSLHFNRISAGYY